MKNEVAIEELLKRIRGGDLQAHGQIVRRYQAMLLGYATHRLADLNTAEEIVQLTFIRAYEQLDDFRAGREMGTWLCVICKHLIMAELERQRREARNENGSDCRLGWPFAASCLIHARGLTARCHAGSKPTRPRNGVLDVHDTLVLHSDLRTLTLEFAAGSAIDQTRV